MRIFCGWRVRFAVAHEASRVNRYAVCRHSNENRLCLSMTVLYLCRVSPLPCAINARRHPIYIYSLQHPTRCAAQSFWMLYLAHVGFARAQTHTRNTHSSQLTQVHLVVITAETGPKALRVFNVMNFCFHYYNILLRFVVWLLSFSHLWLGY